MNKKLLLIAIPALMVMSSCTNLESATKVDLFKEDTIAHEEVFGGQAVRGPAIRKMADVDSDTDYKVGYQIHFDDKGNADGSDDVISIRFVAAIKADYTLMRWTRGVTDSRGAELKALSDNHVVNEETVYFDSKVVYTELNNGAGNDEMVAGEGDYEDYTGFIVYSLLNIPYEDNADAYLGVTLALDEVKTDFYAIKIEKNALGTGSAHTFKFASNKEGFFLAKGDSVVDADASTRDEENNAASFTANLAADEGFLIVQKTASSFKVWDGWCLQDEDLILVNDNGLMKSTVASRYVFFLNKANGIYHTKYDEPTNLYVRGAAGEGWGNDTDDIGISDSYRFITDPDNKAVLLGAALSVGDFKISDQNWSHQWGYTQCKDGGDFWSPNGGNTICIGGAAANFEAGSDGNIHCKTAGTYNIYLTNNWYVSFELAA